MKVSAKFKNIFISVALSIALFAVAIGTALSFTLPTKKVNAAEAADLPSSIEFTQVAAGSDFAVGLTSTGDVYAWSLLTSNESPDDPTGDSSTESRTLGEYYYNLTGGGDRPIKLDVTYVAGPTNNIPSQPSYFAAKDKGTDYAIAVAATRYTAALVSSEGYIYTWGFDADVNVPNAVRYADSELSYNDGYKNHLLLRSTKATEQSQNSNNTIHYEPGIVEYVQLGNVNPATGFYAPLPSSASNYSTAYNTAQLLALYNAANVSIAGGEYNYIVTASSGSGTVFTQVWGSHLYNTTISAKSPLDDPKGSGDNFAVTYGGENSAPVAFASGRTVGFSNTTKGIALRGKNFSTTIKGATEEPVADTESYTPVTMKHANLVNQGTETYGRYIQSQASNVTYRFTDAIAGSNTEATYFSSVANAAGEKLSVANSGTTTLRLSNGSNANSTDGDPNFRRNVNIKTNPVSINENAGFYINNSDSRAYGWYHSNDDAAVTDYVINDAGSTVYSVAAGNTLTAVNNGSKRNMFYGDNTYIVSGDVTAIADVKTTGDSLTLFATSTGVKYLANEVKENAEYVPDCQIGLSRIFNSNNNIVGVYSGYNGTAFGITSLGRLYRFTYDAGLVTPFLYDEFYVQSNGEVEKVNAFSASERAVLEFSGKASNSAPYGTATIYPKSVNVSSTAAVRGSENASLITEHYGNAYRILRTGLGGVPTDSGIQLIDQNLVTVNLNFYLVESASADIPTLSQRVMTEKQVSNYLDVSYTETPTDGSNGIVITPKRSTNGLYIVMRCTVLRYDTVSNFNFNVGGTSQSSANYSSVTPYIALTVEDTKSEVVYNSYSAANQACTVPLLDPNNKSNKYYSIALTNASKGFEELAAVLDSLKLNSATQESILDEIKGKVKSADAGFPASSKVADGNLTYYLGEQASTKFYTDKYPYLVDETDGDLIKVSLSAQGSTNVVATVSPVTVTVNLADLLGVDASNSTALLLSIYKDFNNIYSFYNLSINDQGVLSFSYDVVLLEARGSTGVRYNQGAETTGTSVTGYQTAQGNTSNGQSAWFIPTYTIYRKVAFTNNVWYTPDTTAADETFQSPPTNTKCYPTAFAEPSLRLSIASTSSSVTYDGDSKNSNNSCTINQSVTLGSTTTITLKTLDNNFVDSGKIFFTYNGNTGEFGSFNEQFVGVDGTNYVTLDANKLVISPISNDAIYIDVVVRRYTSQSVNVQNSFGADETITIRFIISVTPSTLTKDTAASARTVTIRENSVLDIFGKSKNPNALSNVLYTGNDVIKNASLVIGSTIKSSDPDILKVSSNERYPSSIDLTIVSAGTVTVTFVVKAFDNTYSDSVTVNAIGMTMMSDAVNLIDTEYIYVAEIFNEVKSTNSGLSSADLPDTFNVLTTTDLENAFYFERVKDDGTTERIVDEDGKDALPAYISSVTFLGNSRSVMRLRIEANASYVGVIERSYLYVRFADSDVADLYENAPLVLEARLSVNFARVALLDESGLSYQIDFDTDKTVDVNEGLVYYNEGGNYQIPLTNLLKIYNANFPNPDEYSVRLVTAQEDNAISYFNCVSSADGKSVIIQPINTTDKYYTVNVSTYTTSVSSESSILILSFKINITGITTTLTKGEYTEIWTVAFFSTLALIIVVMIVRLAVFWNKRGKQRVIIKKNRELIKMRDRMHSKAGEVAHSDLMQTKIKLQDPKLRKAYEKMKHKKGIQDPVERNISGYAENATPLTMNATTQPGAADAMTAVVSPATTTADKSKKAKQPKAGKKKEGKKKSLKELQAELEAKKSAMLANEAPIVEDATPNFNSDFESLASEMTEASGEIVFDADDKA